MHPQRTVPAQALVTQSSAEVELGATVKASQEVFETVSLWMDVGETSWRARDGRCNCSNWDHVTLGLGKGETLEHKLVVGSRKEASRELQYHRVRGGDNSAICSLGCLNTTALCGTPKPGVANSCLGETQSHERWEYRFKTSGRKDACTRMDLHSRTYKTRSVGGPSLRDVAWRVAANARSGNIIYTEDAMNINRDEERRLVEGGSRDFVTVLLLKSVIGQDDHFSA